MGKSGAERMKKPIPFRRRREDRDLPFSLPKTA
jgi:hypothetical protein